MQEEILNELGKDSGIKQKIEDQKKAQAELMKAKNEKEALEKAAKKKKLADEARATEEEAKKARAIQLENANKNRLNALSTIPKAATIVANASDLLANSLIKRAPDKVLDAKLKNPAILAPDPIRFKNAFGGIIKLPKDDYITGKFISATLSGSLKHLIFDKSTKELFKIAENSYKGSVIDENEVGLYVEYSIPTGFNMQWIHQLVSNTNQLVGYLISRTAICFDFSYYIWIAMTMEPNIYVHMEFISRVFQRYASFSLASIGDKREDSIKPHLWEIYEGAQGSSTIQNKVKKAGDLKKTGSLVSGTAIRIVDTIGEADIELRSPYRKISKILVSAFIYSRLKASTKSLLIQALTAISFHKELPQRYGKVITSGSYSLFELVKKSVLTEKLYDASFDIVSCMPIETKMLFLVDIIFIRLLYIVSNSLTTNQV